MIEEVFFFVNWECLLESRFQVNLPHPDELFSARLSMSTVNNFHGEEYFHWEIEVLENRERAPGIPKV